MRSQESPVASTDQELLPFAFDRYSQVDEMADGRNAVLYVHCPTIPQQRANRAFAKSCRSGIVRRGYRVCILTVRCVVGPEYQWMLTSFEGKERSVRRKCGCRYIMRAAVDELNTGKRWLGRRASDNHCLGPPSLGNRDNRICETREGSPD
jgi:hypothetical protein